MESAATLIQPTGVLAKMIREENNEDPSTVKHDLQAIKDWLKKQPHLPDTFDDDRLLSFLRGCSFSMEKCKRKLDMYFTIRAACPEFFTNRDVSRPELVSSLSKIQGPPLPQLTPNGRRVTIGRCTVKDIDVDQMTNIYKLYMMVSDIRLKEELHGVSGDIYILDASVVTPSHVAKLSPSNTKKFFICLQEAYPIKIKEVHVINISPIIEAVLNFVKPFLKEKIRKRIFLHSDASKLQEYIPIDMIPKEYGGNGISMDEMHVAWVKKMGSYTDWFKEQESVKANEDLRPGEPTNYDDLFGIDGSFRKLSID